MKMVQPSANVVQDVPHRPGACRAKALPSAWAVLQPVVLHAVPGQPLPTPEHKRTDRRAGRWLDRALVVAERALGILTLCTGLWWFASGYGYDLVHAWRNSTHHTPAARTQAQPSPASNIDGSRHVLDSRDPTLHEGSRAVEAPQAQVGAGRLTTNELAGHDDNRGEVTPGKPAATTGKDQRPIRVIAPTIRLDSTITEVFVVDGEWEVAQYAVGYLHGTGVAGSGNVVLAGHKGVRGAIFQALEQLQPGDDVWIDTDHDRFHYRVETTYRVWPRQVEVLLPTPAPILTLMTCTTWDTQRFVVRATLVDVTPLLPNN